MRILLLLLAVTLAARSEDLPSTRQLLHSTARITSLHRNGALMIGTGFFFSFQPEKDKPALQVPVIVTCWHVVDGTTNDVLAFALESSTGGPPRQFSITNVDPWIRHPDTNVDLAILRVGPSLNNIQKTGQKLELFPESCAVNDSWMKEHIGIFQEVKFIGYPMGLWDKSNSLPIARRGMTATDPLINYDGRREFLIDAAVFPGSSGSPVLFVEDRGSIYGANGVFGIRETPSAGLLGILAGVFTYTASGEVQIVQIPSKFDAKASTSMPANLGMVIKADLLMDFKPLLGIK